MSMAAYRSLVELLTSLWQRRSFNGLLPFILASSFLIKKYVLFAAGVVIFCKRTYENDWSREERLLFSIWSCMNVWMVIAACNLYFTNGTFFPKEGSLEIDFVRNAGIAFGVFVCSMSCVRSLQRISTLFFCCLATLIVGAFVLWFEEFGNFPVLYQARLQGGLVQFGFDDLSALLGVALVLFWYLRDRPSWLFYFTLVFGAVFLGLCLGRRTLLLFVVFYLICLCWREWCAVLGVFLGSVVGFAMHKISFGALNRVDTAVADASNSSVRILQPVQSQLANEGRLELYRNFFDNFRSLNFLGQDISPIGFTTEGISSFHNVLMDAAWYGGALGFAFALLGLILIFHAWARSRKTVFGTLLLIFILAGQLVAAPPFSNLLGFNLILPIFFLTTLRPQNA